MNTSGCDNTELSYDSTVSRYSLLALSYIFVEDSFVFVARIIHVGHFKKNSKANLVAHKVRKYQLHNTLKKSAKRIWEKVLKKEH